MGSVSQEGNVSNVSSRGAEGSIEVSPVHGFEVGDMVWGKVKSHPWWPGHVYSEELATPSVHRLKRDGLLLVAFFGDSSYGWFDPSELIQFDSNFSEKSLQTNSRTFVKALEEAIDEVRRRTALGLSCMCRNKQNFRQTDAQGFLAVDVVGFEPGSVYSIDTILKARESFQTMLALDFVRQLALEPTDEHNDIDFIKNKATVMSYRSAVYEEFDETYDQAFDGDLVRPLPGSIQVSSPGKKPCKAPLSGRQVFGDTAKLNKPKDHHAKKDKYIFKRRHDPKETKIHQIEKKVKQQPSSPPDVKDPIIATLKSSTMEDEHICNPDFEINTPISSLIHDASSNVEKFVTQNDIPNSEPHKISGVTPCKRPAGDLGSPEKEKKRKKESLIPDGGSLMEEKVSGFENHHHRNKAMGEVNKKKRKKESLMMPQMELPWVLANLHAFALDPLYMTNNRKLWLNVRKVLIKFRSLAFQKSLNSVTGNEATDTHRKSVLPVKPQLRPEDPTKGGIKRDSSHEEITAKKKKKKKKNITGLKISKKTNEDNGRQKSGQEVGKRAEEPTTLKMEFPTGGSLPSISELKAKLGRYGKLDHDGTRIYWKTFTCLVVYRYKADAEVALKAVEGSSNLFGNAVVKYSLKEVSDPEPRPAKVSDHQPAVAEDRAAAGLPMKSCLKRSCSDSGGGGRKKSHVKFNLTGDGSHNKKNSQNGILVSTSSSGVSSSTVQSAPLPPPPLASPPPPRNSMHYPTPLAQPSLPMPPVAPPLVPLQPLPWLNRPAVAMPPPNMDIAQQMVSLLTRCNDVVAHVTGVLGYVPYHPL